MRTSKYVLDFEQPLAELQAQLDQLKRLPEQNKTLVKKTEGKLKKARRRLYGHLTAWQKVKLARHPQRPYALDYIQELFTDFQELHGDRCFGDDPALIGGVGYFQKQPVLILGQQKGRTLKENLYRNFGSPNPEGYRKALRLMRLAERFGLPIVVFIDTPGAYPGIGAEERHIAEAIAVNLREMVQIEVPIIAIVIGEGGSGGALGIGVADRIFVLEYAYYSVISPEGCASILWKDVTKAPEAAEALKLSAPDLERLGVIDGVIPEPSGGAHTDLNASAQAIRQVIERELRSLKRLSTATLLQRRFAKFRRMGVFQESK